MGVTAPQLGLLVMDDGSDFGDDACQRISAMRPTSVRLAVDGAPARDGIRTVATVAPDEFTYKTAIEKAAEEDLFWVVGPRGLSDPLSMLLDCTVAAASALDADHPGFAVAMLDPELPTRKVALVADVEDPITTGETAWAAVGAALVFGAQLDVLVLGVDPSADDEPTDWRDSLDRFSIQGSGLDLVRAAFERAEEHGMEVGWRALGDPANKPAALIRALTEGDYDLVVDDLPPLNVGPKLGRRNRLQAALSQTGSNSTAYKLLRDGPCGVVVVLDAVRMGMVSEDVLRAGAAASLALGVVGVGGAAMTPAGTDDMALHQAAIEQQSTAVADAVAEVGVPAVPPDLDITGMTEQDLAVMQQELNEAIAIRDQKAQELAEQQAQLDAINAELAANVEVQESIDKRPTINERSTLRQYEDREEDLREAEAELSEAKAQTQVVHDAAFQTAESLQHYTQALIQQLDPTVVPTEGGYYHTGTYKQAGPYWSRGWHTGLDFANSTGSDIYAAKNGVVTQAGWGGAYGNLVVIQHDDGTTTWYAHNSQILVSPGQQVSAGQHIAEMGATGNVTGPHLHFEVRDASGNFLDPVAWLGL